MPCRQFSCSLLSFCGFKGAGRGGGFVLSTRTRVCSKVGGGERGVAMPVCQCIKTSYMWKLVSLSLSLGMGSEVVILDYV